MNLFARALAVAGALSLPAHAAALDQLPLPAGAQVPTLSPLPAGAPGYPRGGVLVAWCDSSSGEPTLRCVAWAAGKMSAPMSVTHGPHLAVNWADPPGVTVGAASAGYPWIAHWTVERAGGEEAADIQLAASLDRGATWGPAMAPYDETAAVERGFAAVSAAGGQAGRVFWLDGRHRPSEARAPIRSQGPGESERPGTEVRCADLGVGTAADGSPHLRVLADQVVDPRACDCCPLGVASAGDEGHTLVFYRDRSSAEVRDISVAVVARGAEPEPHGFSLDGWKIEGCPVNGPAVAPRPGARDAWVAWFTAAADSPRVLIALADSVGSRVGEPLVLEAGKRAAGRVSVVALEDGSAIAGWIERREKRAALRLARVVRRGDVLEAGDVGVPEIALPSPRNVARLAVWQHTLFLAWTETTAAGGEQARVATVSLAAPAPRRPARR